MSGFLINFYLKKCVILCCVRLWGILFVHVIFFFFYIYNQIPPKLTNPILFQILIKPLKLMSSCQELRCKLNSTQIYKYADSSPPPVSYLHVAWPESLWGAHSGDEVRHECVLIARLLLLGGFGSPLRAGFFVLFRLLLLFYLHVTVLIFIPAEDYLSVSFSFSEFLFRLSILVFAVLFLLFSIIFFCDLIKSSFSLDFSRDSFYFSCSLYQHPVCLVAWFLFISMSCALLSGVCI